MGEKKCQRLKNEKNMNSLESSWRDLSDWHSFAPLRPQLENVRHELLRFFTVFKKNHQQFAIFVMIYVETWLILDHQPGIFSEFQRLSRKCRKSDEIRDFLKS